MGGGRSCTVIGCSNRSNPAMKRRFYGFPVEQTIRDVWMTFTRRDSDYVIKSSSYICEDHFDPSCFVFKKKQICLAKNTVPTIFNRNTTEGETERIVLTFDRDVMHYVEEDTLLNPVYDKEKREEELIAKRERKLKEIQKLCRFCLEDSSEESLIEITKLREYSINPTEVMTLVGLETSFSEMFSANACEECFQQIFVFDGYRKRCKKAQDRLIYDIRQLEQEIQRVNGNVNSWLKSEASTNWNDDDTLMDDSFGSNKMSPAKKSAEPEFHHIIVKQERKEEQMSDDEYTDYQSIAMDDDEDDPHDYITADLSSQVFKVPNLPTKKEDYSDVDIASSSFAIKNLTGYEEDETAGIVESPFAEYAKQPNKCRIFECFFCRVKFTGRTVFKSHECPVKDITCEVLNCGKKFIAISGFNSHIRKLHKLPKVARFYCKFCKLSKTTTQEEFNAHSVKCELIAVKALDNPVTCEMCGKVCANPKAFAIHMMFHKTGNKSFDEDSSKPVTKFKKLKKGIFICENCGKEFATERYLADHVKRIHATGTVVKEIFCDHCGKSYADKYAVRKHIKCVHSVQPSPCQVCGKVFRNKTLLKAHMILHDQSKRIHFCLLCPDKPPYVTGVALKRHQEAAHGYGSGYNCDLCTNGYKTKSGLTQHKAAAHSEPNVSSSANHSRSNVSNPEYQNFSANLNFQRMY